MADPEYTALSPRPKVAPEYDWRVSVYKGLKVGFVSAAAYIVADPTLVPGVIAAVPNEYRMVAMIALPMLFSAIKNWIKNQNPDAV